MPSAKDLHVNQALTNFAIKYSAGPGFVADDLFPIVPVKKESDTYHIFTKDDLDDTVETLRADGDTANEIEWSTSTANYSAEEHALRHLVTDRVQRNADAPIRPKMRATELIIHKVRMGIEKRVHDIVVDTVTINSAVPAVKWDAAANVVIETNIDAGKEAFLLQCGVEPNLIVIPPAVAKVAKRDSTIRDLIRYTQSDLLVNGDLPPTMFNLRVMIPGSIANTANAGLAQSIARIWSEDRVVLAYVAPSVGQETMTAGVQFRVNQGGAGTVLVSEYRVDERKGDMVEASIINDEVAVCTDALYILDDVLT